MRRIFFYTILMICGFAAYAYSPTDLRFHSEQDTLKINSLLEEGAKQNIRTPNQGISYYAEQLLGTPYVAHTLESSDGKEYLTVNISELDCTTFVETLMALTQATLDGRTSWRDYITNLEHIRYHNGHIDGYASRLHYICQWAVENIARGTLRDITADVEFPQYAVKTINFMSRNRDKYPALADSTVFAQIKGTEVGFHSHRFPFIKKTSTGSKTFQQNVKSGDILAITTKIDGLDVTHMAIVKKNPDNGKIYIIHASSSLGKVVVSSDELKEFLRRNLSSTGVRVLRMIKN